MIYVITVLCMIRGMFGRKEIDIKSISDYESTAVEFGL